MRPRNLLLPLLLLAAIPTDAEASQGCSCRETEHLRLLAAQARETLPTNVRFPLPEPILDRDNRAFEIVASPSREPVPGHMETLPGVTRRVLVLDAPLAPGARYWLTYKDPERRAQLSDADTFLTAPGPDLRAPTIKSVNIRPAAMSGACGRQAMVSVWLVSDEPLMAYRMSIRSERGTSSVVLLAVAPWLGYIDMTPGMAVCWNTLPDAAENVDYTAMVSGIDAAGNESEPFGPVAFRFQEMAPRANRLPGATCGCSSAVSPVRAPWAVGCVALAVAVVRRRTRRRRVVDRETTREPRYGAEVM